MTNKAWTLRISCSLCGHDELEDVVVFPDTPLANEYGNTAEQAKNQERFPLKVVMCVACRHAQSSIIVSPERLFQKYVYETSTSSVTIEHLRNQARQIEAKFHLREGASFKKPFIVEVGSNDGAFLKQMRDVGIEAGCLLGIDPAKEMAAKANKDGLQTMNAFFTDDVVAAIVKNRGLADVVVANNVLAHVPDVKNVLNLIRQLLADDGVLVMEVAHAVDVLSGAFDTIYHEHMSHHALRPLVTAFNSIGMRVIDVEVDEKQTGRGSLRIYATPHSSRRWPDVQAANRCLSVLELEKNAGVLDPFMWKRKIGDLVVHTSMKLQTILKDFQHATVAGYGAPAKLTTLTYACELNLNPSDVAYVIDDSPWKMGLFTPGLGWPIVGGSMLKEKPPAVVVLFAWNFADSIAKRLREEGFAGPIVAPLPTWRFLP